MTSLINFSGIASGIDSSALIKALLDQQRSARIKPLETRIAAFTDTNTALGEFTDLLAKLKSAANKFRTVSGSALTKTASSTDETILTGTANNSATNGVYDLNISQRAKNATYSFRSTDFTYSSNTSTINADINNAAAAANRTVTVTVGTGSDQTSVAFVATNTSTLQDFADYVNANSSGKATAAVVNAGSSSSPDYRVVITTANEGTQKGQIAVSVGSEITNATSGSNRDAFNNNTQDQATDASFTITGISGSISRSTNSISDVIPGVTFNLVSTGSAKITIGDDASATTATIQEFVDAFNDVVKYANENDVVVREEDSEGATNIFGSLASTSLDENTLSVLRSALSNARASGGSVNVFADLGITTERDGTLKFDTAVFKTALSNDPTSIKTLTTNLGETLSAVGGSIDQFTRFNGLIDLAVNSNKNEISSLQNKISDIEKSLGKQEESLVAQFSRLESLIGQLNSQQSNLAALLPQRG